MYFIDSLLSQARCRDGRTSVPVVGNAVCMFCGTMNINILVKTKKDLGKNKVKLEWESHG